MKSEQLLRAVANLLKCQGGQAVVMAATRHACHALQRAGFRVEPPSQLEYERGQEPSYVVQECVFFDPLSGASGKVRAVLRLSAELNEAGAGDLWLRAGLYETDASTGVTKVNWELSAELWECSTVGLVLTETRLRSHVLSAWSRETEAPQQAAWRVQADGLIARLNSELTV